MNDLERLWRERDDPLLVEAADNLDDYTEEARRVIAAEMARRGLEMPEAEADGDEEEAAIVPAERPVAGGAAEVPPVEGPLSCMRCGLELDYLGEVSLSPAAGGLLAQLVPLLEGQEGLNVYKCPQCGHIDLFANGDVEHEDGDQGAAE